MGRGEQGTHPEDPQFHLEILALAETDDAGKLFFSPEAEDRLKGRFQSVLEDPSFPAAVDGYVRAVAALQAGEQGEAAAQLIRLGTAAVEAMQAKAWPSGDEKRLEMTGGTSLTRMKPVGTEPAPEGAQKATKFIRPLPQPRRR